MSEIFAKCGFNRKTKREILYGPAHLGGANFRTLYSVQGIGQVLTMIKFWRSPCQAGQLLRIAVAWAQYVAGISNPIFEDVGTHLPQLETKWISSLREYLQYTRCTIELDEAYLLKREREHDWHIMDAIVQCGLFSPAEIRQLNYCRLYLQVSTISDLATAQGESIDKNIGSRSTGSLVMQHEQMAQCQPTETCRQTMATLATSKSPVEQRRRQVASTFREMAPPSVPATAMVVRLCINRWTSICSSRRGGSTGITGTASLILSIIMTGGIK
jgi:hypothetical protein